MNMCAQHSTRSRAATTNARWALSARAVYGNFSDASGTGVCFTRNPATGEKGLWGEFLQNAQVNALM